MGGKDDQQDKATTGDILPPAPSGGARVPSRRTLSRRIVFVSLLAVPAFAIGACAAADRPPALDAEDAAAFVPPGNGCSIPTSPGCECDEPGRVINCGRVVRRSNDLVSCAVGTQLCENGRWSECQGDKIAVRPAARTGSTRPLSAARCADECNPDCWIFDSNDGGFAVDVPGMTLQDGGGITLLPSDAARGGAVDGRACDDRPDADNLLCRQLECAGGALTSVTGTVYDPAGVNPIPNVVVYVPNRPLEAFPAGVQANRCAVPSGRPVAYAVTDYQGRFTIQNVPTGANVPFVLQVGKFRRTIVVPGPIQACQDNVVESLGLAANQFRLPRNKGEGDIPQMAIATGQVDPFECLMRKIGIEDSEFTVPSQSGKIHMYRENGVNMPAPGSPPATQLTNSVSTLRNYDVVIFPCEADAYWKSDRRIWNVAQYTSLGGRVFATHFSYTWVHGNGASGNSNSEGVLGLLPYETTSRKAFVSASGTGSFTASKFGSKAGNTRPNSNAAPDVGGSGTPAVPLHVPLLIDVTESGGRGTAKFRWSVDDGVTWSSELQTANSVALAGAASGITINFNTNNGNDYEASTDWYAIYYTSSSTSRSGTSPPQVFITGDVNATSVGASVRVRVTRAGSLQSATKMQFQWSADDGATWSPVLDAPTPTNGWLDYGTYALSGPAAGLSILFPDRNYSTNNVFVASPSSVLQMTQIGGTNAPNVALAGNPNGPYQFLFQITTGGALGTAQFRWSSDDGSTWAGPIATAARVTLGATGVAAVFASGTYSTAHTYRADTAFSARPFRNTANWSIGRFSQDDIEAYVNTNFSRGKIFGDWLNFVGATPDAYGVIDVLEPRINAMSVIPPAQQWMGDMKSMNGSPGIQIAKSPSSLPNLTVTPLSTRPKGMHRITIRITQAGTLGNSRWEWTANEVDDSGNTRWYDGGATSSSNKLLAASGGLDTGLQVKFGSYNYAVGNRYDLNPPVFHMTFNTPLEVPEDQKVGRVVFSDFHVSSNGADVSKTFPASCKDIAMTPQEKALEYMLFDLAACVTVDTRPPAPPIPPYTRPAEFEMEFTADCARGKALRWGFFDWKAVTPGDSKIEFRIQTFDGTSAPHAPFVLGVAEGASSVAHWTGVDVDDALSKRPPPLGPIRSRSRLKVIATLIPTSDGYEAPTLLDRRVQYVCRDAE